MIIVLSLMEKPFENRASYIRGGATSWYSEGGCWGSVDCAALGSVDFADFAGTNLSQWGQNSVFDKGVK